MEEHMSIVKLNQKYTYEQLIKDAIMLGNTFHEILQCKNIGYSWCRQRIPMLLLGKGGKKIFLTAGVHGRESVNPIVLMRMVEDYCQAYRYCQSRRQVDINKLLNTEVTFCVIPLVNPDGYTLAIENPEKASWKENIRGVDINRNFPSITWRKKWNRDCPASEVETQILMRAFCRLNPSLYIDYHSRGKSIFYYRNQMDEVYNREQRRIGELLSKETGYKLEEPEHEIEQGDSGGNTVHFVAENWKCPAITIETVEEAAEFPLSWRYQWQTFREVAMTPVVAAKIIL